MLDVAVIGLGWWGKILVETLSSSAKIRVVRLFDVDADAGGAFAGERGIAFADSFEAVLADSAVGAVVLATPHSLHERQIVAAAGAGKHVFCEKPLGLDRASASRALDSVRRAGVSIGIGHERRFEPPVMKVADLARGGRLGALMHIEGNFSHDIFTRLGEGNWRLDPSESPAGGLTATLVHLTDLSISLFGQPERVRASCGHLGGTLANGDTLSTHVEFSGGRTATLNALTHTPFFSRLAVFGSDGWAEVRDKAHVQTPEGWFLTTCLGDGGPETEETGPATPVLANLEAFADAISGGAAYPNTPGQMLMNVSLLEAIVRSCSSGAVEEVER